MKILPIVAGAVIAASAATAAFATPIPISRVSVTIGEELQEKAGKYGERDVNDLAERLRGSVERELGRNGALAEDGARLELVITDARPNRPTFREMARNPSLSFESVSLGGAEIRGELVAADGTRTPVSYRWYENDLAESYYGWTWSDAYQSFDQFARRVADGNI
ncbi:MAG: hypothetical protein U1E50_03365 [Caulobacteraceae bacterium]